MSSPEASRRTLLRLASAGLIALSASACFRPLYGPTASGEPLQEVLASIDVLPISPGNYDRLGHYLRSDLIFELNGSGIPRPKRYTLTVSYALTLQTPIVDQTARADAATLFVTASYTLASIEGGRPPISGKLTSSATYDRSTQRFANVRAARDAEIRVARDLADQIRLRIAAALATGTS